MNISQKRIKSKVEKDGRVLVVENIKYPVFEDDKNKVLCGRMNKFYRAVAEKYSGYGNKILPRKLIKAKLKLKTPFYIAMNFACSVNENGIISVVLDLTYSEGKNVKMRRFSQMWSVEKQDVLTQREFLTQSMLASKTAKSRVVELAKENAENPAFGYFGDYLLRLNKAFSISNCFALPTGVAFFVQAGTLCKENYGASTFVVPYSRLYGVVNGKFLQNNSENSVIEGDNVNKV